MNIKTDDIMVMNKENTQTIVNKWHEYDDLCRSGEFCLDNVDYYDEEIDNENNRVIHYFCCDECLFACGQNNGEDGYYMFSNINVLLTDGSTGFHFGSCDVDVNQLEKDLADWDNSFLKYYVG